MTIAASDSGGGAGLAADLKSFGANGVHGVFALTAVTAQNTAEVRAVEVMPAAIVDAQIECVLADFDVSAVKTGLLFGAETGRLVAARLAGRPNLVIDPVLVTSSGRRILDATEIDAVYRDELFPRATVLTPNYAEASLLTGVRIESIDDMAEAARRLGSLGPEHVVVTGWLTDAEAVDVHYTSGVVTELREPRIRTRNVHGSGCSFAAGIAAGLAAGADVETAISAAKRFVATAIWGARDWRLGSGHGPIDHLGFTVD
jgi:hydroxymethylpyrimidine/phosphomethylpyrimidine kinase